MRNVLIAASLFLSACGASGATPTSKDDPGWSCYVAMGTSENAESYSSCVRDIEHCRGDQAGVATTHPTASFVECAPYPTAHCYEIPATGNQRCFLDTGECGRAQTEAAESGTEPTACAVTK